MTTAATFHPMKGDVYEGNTITMPNGDIWTIQSGSYGWQLVNQDGTLVYQQTQNEGANDLAAFIYNHS
jgi:hypothetical protein